MVISLEAEAGGALRAIKQVTQTVDRLAHRTVGTAGMPQLSRSVQDATRQVRQLESETGRLSSTLSRVKGLVAGAFTIGAITAFGKKALEASANMEVFKKGLSFTLGSSGEADKLVRSIQEIGEASAYDTTQLLPLARQWVNIGETADGARAKMQKIVDLGSAFGMQTDQVQAANLALTQMSMAGKIGAQDMMQLINAGVPAWQLLADKMGLSVSQVRDLSQQGALGEEAINALWDAITEKTKGAAATMGNTLMAKFSNMQETVSNSMAIIGDLISQGFDLKGVLGEAGNVAESFKTHLANIRETAKNIGIKQAIVDELMAISPAAGTAASVVLGAFGAIARIIKKNWSAIKTLIEAIVAFGGTYVTISKIYSAIMLVRNGFTLAKIAAMAFNAVSALNPWVLALTAIIGIIALLVTHWDEVKQAATSAINAVKKALDGLIDKISNGVSNAIKRAKDYWNEFVDAFKHPVDAIINVVTRNSSSGSAPGHASGGLIGYATGGHVRGAGTGTSDSIPAMLSNGEYVLNAKAVQRIGVSNLDSLNRGGTITQYASGGSSIMAAYNAAKNGGNDTLGSIAKGISGAGGLDAGMTAYEQAMGKMVARAREIGIEVSRFRDYLAECKTNADAYNASGEKTLSYQKSIADITANIGQLQTKLDKGTASEKDAARLALLTKQRETMIANYAAESDAAKAAYAEAAAYRTTVEVQATQAIANLRKQAETDVYSHATAVAESRRQEERARNAQSLSEFLDIMAAKDEVTGQSYATTLANEQYLAEQRRMWMDELMLASVSWGEYMQTMLTNMAIQIQDGLASGIAQCVVEGKKFSELLKNLAKTLLKQLIQGVVQKLISGWIMAIGLGNNRHKTEMKNMAAETEALGAKLSVETGIAAAAAVAANPQNPAAAAAKAVAAVGAAVAAGAALGKAAMKVFKTNDKSDGSGKSNMVGLAKGGVVTGPTAALIGEGRYSEAVLPLKPSLLDKLFGSGGQQTVVATQNIYGDINTRDDEEDAMGMFNDMVLAGLRGA